MIRKLTENMYVRVVGVKAFVGSKLNNEEGNYIVGAIIGICILIIAALAMKVPIGDFTSSVLTKLTTWGSTTIDKEIS